MSKIDKVVLRETAYIAVWTLIFSTLLQAVFLMTGLWNMTVLLGNVYSAVIVVLNFFLMGLSIQKAITKDEKDVKSFVKATGTFRLLFLFLAVVVGVLLPWFNIWAVVVPLFFPRVAISLRPMFGKMDADYAAPAEKTEEIAKGAAENVSDTVNNEKGESADE